MSSVLRRTAPHVRLGAVLALLVALALSAGPALAEPRTVRVGVYENEPKVFTDGTGQAAGIFMDVLRAVAAEEGWTLVYVRGEWAQDLSALESGEIDIMPDVAYSEERDAVFDFHSTPVVDSWSYVYAAPGERIDGISQLDGKRVAVLAGSIQETVFERMVKGFGYDVTLVRVDSLNEAFEAVQEDRADAAIANHLFGDYFFRHYGLAKTPIVFNPVPLHFATAQGRNADLLDAIDRHLNEWIREPDSPYYQALGRWMAPEPEPRVPGYLAWTLGVVIAMFVVSAGMVLLLRWRVADKTRYLEEARAAHQDAEQKLRLALDAADEGIWEWSPKTGDLAWSDRCYTMLGYDPGEFPMDTARWTELTHPEDRDATMTHVRGEMATGDRSFWVQWRALAKDGSWRWVDTRGQAVDLDAAGEVERAIGTHTDVTDRKSAELELERHRDHLEELVEERTPSRRPTPPRAGSSPR